MYAVCEFGGHLDWDYIYVYANGLLLGRYDNSLIDEKHYYHHDGLGSIIGITDKEGNVEKSYFYDEFGDSLGYWGTESNHYLYTGQEYDDEIYNAELYNYRARYYDYRVGRFISEETIWQTDLTIILPHNRWYLPGLSSRYNPQQLNPYVYVTNNPVNHVDPSGMVSIPTHGNWCGPEHTGGHDKSIDDMTHNELKSLLPYEDCADRCCMHHDFCRYKCRRKYRKRGESFGDCKDKCDAKLLLCFSLSSPIIVGPRSYTLPYPLP